MLIRAGRTGCGAGAAIMAAVAIAAVAIAGLAAAPAADVAPWAAYAQSPATTVKIGALVSNASDSDFPDNDRRAVLAEAVRMFNDRYGDIDLDLSVTEFVRNDTAVTTGEPDALRMAYDGGAGPRFYIGPTTSQGIANINGTADTRDLLEGDDVLLISPSSEAPQLAAADNIFRLAFNAARQGDMLVEEMSSAGIKSYIVVARNDAWGRQIAASVGEKAGQEGLTQAGQPVTFDIDRTAAHWEGIRDSISASAGSVPDGEERIGVVFLGYGDDYPDMAAAANASAAIRANTTWFAPSSAGIGAPSPIASGTTRDFSAAVGLTALSQDVAANDVTRGIDGRLGKNATFYEYSTHDSVFVLGNAMRMAMAAGEDAGNVTMVKKYIAAAAMNYTGAALGDGLLLDGNGDLRAPDSFTVHAMDRATGEWSGGGGGRTVSSAVTLVGALLALDSGDYPDNNARDALLLAAADYNAAADRGSLVKLITYNITDPNDPDGYVALDALTRAHDGGGGPSAYIGPSLSSNVGAVMDYIAGNNVLLIGYGSESEELSIPGDNLFRTAVSTDRHGRFMAQAMADAGVRSVVTVVRNDSWGVSYNASIADALGPNGLRLAGTVRFAEGNTEWNSTLDAISAAVAEGAGRVGVAFVGTDVEQGSVAAAALADAAAGSVQWFVSPTGFYDIADAAERDFARAVNLTAIVNDVVDSDKKSDLDARAGVGLDFYDYAAYDALFILGNTIASAVESGRTSGGGVVADDLRPLVPAQADAYDGILGDIALDANGDLGSPDRFAVWQVDDTGEWEKGAGAPKSTPVVRIGALLAIDSTDYPDNLARDALRQASADFNAGVGSGGADRPFFVSLTTYDITDAADPGGYAALDALARAHDGGNGPSIYVGPSLSSNIEAVLGYAARNDLLLLGYASESESLSTAGDNLFRMAISTDRHGRFMAQAMADADVRSVVTVVRDDSWGRSLNASIAAALGANGMQLAGAVAFAPGTDADWPAAIGEVSSAIAGGSGKTGVAFVGVRSEQDALAAAAMAAQGNATIDAVPWFVTPSGFYRDMPEATRSFARSVGMTAIVLDVEDGAGKAALDARVPAGNLSFYEYAAYDGLIILGNSVAAAAAAAAAGDPAGIGAAGLGAVIPSQAGMYEGILGDIALNSKGDLRSPDRFAVWQVDNATGMWADTGVTMSTPVFDIGALLVLDGNPLYTDDLEKAAMDQAVDDFNAEHEAFGDFYIDLAVQRISIAPGAGSPDPDALAGLMGAHADGDGPSLYVGPSTSANSERVLGYANANDIVLVSHSSTALSLATPGDNLFRMASPDGRQAGVLAGLISGDGVTDLVMAVRGDTWGRGVDEGTTARLAGLPNGTAVSRVSFSEYETDWPGVAARLGAAIDSASASAAARPQGKAAVLFIGFYGDLDGVAAQAPSVPSLASVGWFGADGVGNRQAVTSNAASLAFARDVGMTTVIFTARDSGAAPALDPAAAYGPSAYDAVRVMAEAIKAAYDGSSSSSSGGAVPPALDVKAAIPAAAAAYSGALGNVTLDGNGDLLYPETYGVYRIGAGDTWSLACVQVAGGPQGACSVEYVTIGELFAAEAGILGPLNDAVHKAYVLAVEDYNGGLAAAGSPLRLQLERIDTPLTSPVDAVIRAHANGSGPVAYLGPVASRGLEQLARFAGENSLVVVTPAAMSSNLAARDNVFRLSLIDRYEADLITIAAQREGVGTILPVLTDSLLGQSYAREIRVEAGVLGMDYLDPVYVPFTLAESNLSSTVAEINRAVARLESGGTNLSSVGVIAVAPNKDLHSLAHYAVEYPLLASVKWFEPTGLHPPQPIVDPETLRLARTASFYSLSWDIPQTERLERVRDTLAQREGHPPNRFSYAAYDAVHMLADAIRMSMAADGTYTGDEVASNMHAAADGLDGLLGSNLRLDENGDRILPNRAVIWKTSDEGAWVDTTDRAELIPVCSVSLERDTIEFGSVGAGGQSDVAAQTITNVGTLPVASMSIGATDWTNAAGSAVLDKGATKVMVGGGEWTPLPAAVEAVPDGVQTEAMFRLDVPGGTPQSSAGAAGQTVEYTVSCMMAP